MARHCQSALDKACLHDSQNSTKLNNCYFYFKSHNSHGQNLIIFGPDYGGHGAHNCEPFLMVKTSNHEQGGKIPILRLFKKNKAHQDNLVLMKSCQPMYKKKRYQKKYKKHHDSEDEESDDED